MGRILRKIVEYIAVIHDFIQNFLELNFGVKDDKIMHFIVIGIIGFVLMTLLKPLFKYLVKHKMVVTIDFIYCFSFIIVLTFAIEIGQKITGTGDMEFSDIAYGIGGFLLFAFIYFVLYSIIRLIKNLIYKNKAQNSNNKNSLEKIS